MNNNSIEEEKYRLDYFFPKFDMKIISSFFPIDIKNKNIIITSPIIPNLVKKGVCKNKIIVYFSPYSDSANYVSILNIIKNYQQYVFKVYTANDLENYRKYFKYNHISFSNFNKDFKDDLCSSVALLTTGGHQLLSEAIALDVPVFVFPLDTYEQKYNALMIEKYKIGMVAKNFSKKEFEEFINNNDSYHNNMIEFKKKYYNPNWKDVIANILKKY